MKGSIVKLKITYTASKAIRLWNELRNISPIAKTWCGSCITLSLIFGWRNIYFQIIIFFLIFYILLFSYCLFIKFASDIISAHTLLDLQSTAVVLFNRSRIFVPFEQKYNVWLMKVKNLNNTFGIPFSLSNIRDKVTMSCFRNTINKLHVNLGNRSMEDLMS